MITNTAIGRKLIDITGKRFGMLVVVDGPFMKNHKAYWECQCDCGSVPKRIISHCLRYGESKSCGCLVAKAMRKVATTHGMSSLPEYKIWKNIITRCTNPKSKSYARYGAVGIGVCKEWRDDFASFYKSMGCRPSTIHSIERIDNSKGYCPNNCKWGTDAEQRRNKSTNHMIEHNGLRLCIADWSAKTGLHKNTIRNRLILGWSVAKTLTTPSRSHIPL